MKIRPESAQELATEALKNSINIPPTGFINHGTLINVMVARDVDFGGVYEVVKPYENLLMMTGGLCFQAAFLWRKIMQPTQTIQADTSARNALDRLGISDYLNRDGVTEVIINRPNEIFLEKFIRLAMFPKMSD
ncbi:hypothetical protein [Neisseria gonorrhoeae]|uniref:hypothetical protein n=1 Tax=Neisseria gonorrhoeae TaxID=485 RepID=UPI000DFC1B67|nr:hypothetical protein [Neisseria gonorrhoeae]SUA04963.1 Type IV secretion system protein virB10 [Neisseria gonorrhoeae]